MGKSKSILTLLPKTVTRFATAKHCKPATNHHMMVYHLSFSEEEACVFRIRVDNVSHVWTIWPYPRELGPMLHLCTTPAENM
jgi:hypothetical protein